MSYEQVMERVAAAALDSGRDPSSVTVVAIGKTKTPEDIMEIYRKGHRDFGENRANELAEKAAVLPGDIRWHFVGSLQSNKARTVRPIAHLLHSMDRVSLAQAWLKGIGKAPPVLLQVNLASEQTKSGVEVDEAAGMLRDLSALGIEVRGLMAIPPAPTVPEESRPYFARLRDLAQELGGPGAGLTELSMGMTDDFEVAIEEGASLIRLGRAIFGDRK